MVMMWLVPRRLQSLCSGGVPGNRQKYRAEFSEEMLSRIFGTLCRSQLGLGTQAAMAVLRRREKDRVRRLVVCRKGRGTLADSAWGAVHAGSIRSRGQCDPPARVVASTRSGPGRSGEGVDLNVALLQVAVG